MSQETFKACAFYVLAAAIIVCSLTVNGLLAFLVSFRSPINPNFGRTTNERWKIEPPYPDDRLENIFWFVQVTDLHISEHVRPKIVPDLIEWCVQVHQVVKPQLILATGDLTDAKATDQVSSFQHKLEWERYNEARKSCYQRAALTSNEKLAPWIDIRGNHDSFDMDLQDANSLSVSWFTHNVASQPQNVSHLVIDKGFGRYSFIGVDFSPQPGPSRPLNFFGYYNQERDGDKLSEFVELESRSNLTFFFGHHTLNVVTSSEKFLATMKYGAVYLCGHLHALLNNTKSTLRLYGYHHLKQSSLLELELADFQGNRRFRIMAVDHDMLSFTDVSTNQWPVVVITCPKHAQYAIPEKERLERMRYSTHIRMLVFSPSSIKSVSISIRTRDSSNTIWEAEAVHSEGPLYVAKWDPALFETGLFIIHVIAEDSQGRKSEVEQPFSLDGSTEKLPFLSSLVIASDLTRSAKFLFWTAHFAILVLMFFLRFKTIAMKRLHLFNIPVVGNMLHKLWFYAQNGHLVKPFVLYQLLIAYAPWYIGALLSNRYAVVFVNGVLFMDGTFIPSGLNYVFGACHLLLFDIPIIYSISSALERSILRKSDLKLSCQHSSCEVVKYKVMMFIAFLMIIWQCHKSFELFLNYGILAICTNVVEFYCIFMYVYQFYFAFHL
ncbi:transmembrane protein 62-like [Convolutriloba macropyga]|uniref:transmembrane protein 62-like n=1 Tax=Convolutriloba macropyga TaxID=536237 RepID=UPI003F51C2C8